MIADWMTPDEAQGTLASIRPLDDHPLYLLDYRGPTPPVAARTDLLGPGATPPGCSVFVAAADPHRLVIGRNFDFPHHPAVVVRCAPPGAHASIAIADVSYLGFDLDDAQAMTDPSRNEALLLAPLLPFDGMNERGVFAAMAAVPSWQLEVEPGRPAAGSVSVLRPVLDGASNVDDAVDILRGHNIDFEDDPPLHYMFADATGASAVVEFVDGHAVVQPRSGAWQLMVNFTLATSTPALRADDWRWTCGSERLAAASGDLNWRQAVGVLEAVQQDDTQWSAVYEPAALRLHLATGRRFERVHELAVRS